MEHVVDLLEGLALTLWHAEVCEGEAKGSNRPEYEADF